MLKYIHFFSVLKDMNMIECKNLIYPSASNPEKAVQEIKKHLKKSEIREIELDLSAMNILDAVKVLVLTSSYLYKKSPEEKLKFRFVSPDIENILSSFSLTNLEMV